MVAPPRTQPSDLHLPPVTYERESGSAWAPLPRDYRRREPEKTALYEVVRRHLKTLFEESRQRSEEGARYPHFIEHEFRRFLGCGILAQGSARMRCPECGLDRLVAFSCKGRPVVPTAIRRAGLVGHSLPVYRPCPSRWARPPQARPFRASPGSRGPAVGHDAPPRPLRSWWIASCQRPLTASGS